MSSWRPEGVYIAQEARIPWCPPEVAVSSSATNRILPGAMPSLRDSLHMLYRFLPSSTLALHQQSSFTYPQSMVLDGTHNLPSLRHRGSLQLKELVLLAQPGRFPPKVAVSSPATNDILPRALLRQAF